ncbi:long-chain-fatty-acid--CoA ligase [Amycolatopsis acidicola]|uniref:Long-chain-fatty-acid--CoA ligase n=1 Tax=Amycolatopsis acidicola TaxID=2596893 RepID=A0A5N0UYU7_9PSEU|nr:long-chain-fatty-acid--CoA ligase [Amycolatopsis acidicola]KAA9156918.1 long-chain-fatty-acid--CoA ligase [Amycolatopsis acidicola]
MDGAHWCDHLTRHAFTRPDATAVRFEGRSFSWRELHRRVRALAGWLSGRGVGRGDRVAILMTNRPEFLETLIAANALGAIAVPVNFRLAPAEIAYILGDSGASVLITDPGLEDQAREAAGAGLTVLVTGESYEDVIAAGAVPPEVTIAEADTALIMYTSGTTGRPKGAMLSHLNLLLQSLTVIRAWRLHGDDEVYLCGSPLFHIGALGGVAPLVLIGGTTVIMPSGSFDAPGTLDLLESEQVTSTFLVPAQWQLLCADPATRERARTLRTVSWGAAPATVDLLRRMGSTFPGAAIVALFGQTEMSPVTCVLEGTDAERKIGSVGKPVPTVAARVVDETMRDLPPGEIGEIVYRGPGTMSGYWNNPEATAEAFEGGWFHSGDLVRVDDEGFVYVVDRKKDMIISGGENIYCAEVENVLADHPGVGDVAVIGIKHERWGETPLAVVVPAGSAPTLDELTAWCRDKLASYKRPTALEVVDALPRNASGKVVKHELRARFS